MSLLVWHDIPWFDSRQSGWCRFISANLNRADLRIPLQDSYTADFKGLQFSDPAMQQQLSKMSAQQSLDAQTAALQYSSAELRLQRMEAFAAHWKTETQKMQDDSVALAHSDVTARAAAKSKASELVPAALFSIARAQQAILDEAAADYRVQVNARERARLIRLIDEKRRMVEVLWTNFEMSPRPERAP